MNVKKKKQFVKWINQDINSLVVTDMQSTCGLDKIGAENSHLTIQAQAVWAISTTAGQGPRHLPSCGSVAP